MRPTVQPFFDLNTGTMTYVVYEKPGSPCAIVDSVLDYDPKAARTSTRSADAVKAFVREAGAGGRCGFWRRTRTPIICRRRLI